MACPRLGRGQKWKLPAWTVILVILLGLLALVYHRYIPLVYNEENLLQQFRIFSSKETIAVRARKEPSLKETIADCAEIAVDAFKEGDPTWVRTTTLPSFYMHVHDLKEDSISEVVGKNGCYECDLLPYTINALQSRPDAVFIDIGANMGLYSLTAAAAGHEVVAFEPVKKSYRKFCESVQVNPGFSDKITVIRRATAAKHTIVRFGFWPGNYAGIRTVEGGSVNAGHVEGEDFTRTVTLDSLEGSVLPTDRPVVLKIDVEGQECNALSGGLKYLEKVDILYVQIEWTKERLQACEGQRRQEIFELFARKGLRPYLMHNGHSELDPSKWQEWRGQKRGPNFDVGWFKTKP